MKLQNSPKCLPALFLLACFPASLQGDVLDETLTVTKDGTQYKLNTTGEDPADRVEVKIVLNEGECENIRFANASGGEVTIRNTSSPAGQDLKDDVVVQNGETSDPIPFCCNADHGTWLFEVGDGVGGDTDAVLEVILHCRGIIPTVSAWGLVVMLLLMVAAGTVVIRRRAAVV